MKPDNCTHQSAERPPLSDGPWTCMACGAELPLEHFDEFNRLVIPPKTPDWFAVKILTDEEAAEKLQSATSVALSARPGLNPGELDLAVENIRQDGTRVKFDLRISRKKL